MRVWERAAPNEEQIELYYNVFVLSALKWSTREIAAQVQVSSSEVNRIQKELEAAMTQMPPNEMTRQAVNEYLTLHEHVQDEMMKLYAHMSSDYALRRRGEMRRGDGTTVPPVQPKDLIQLLQNIATHSTQKLGVIKHLTGLEMTSGQASKELPASPKSLSRPEGEDIIDAEFQQLDDVEIR